MLVVINPWSMLWKNRTRNVLKTVSEDDGHLQLVIGIVKFCCTLFNLISCTKFQANNVSFCLVNSGKHASEVSGKQF